MTRDCACACSSHRRRRGVSFVLTCVLLFTALGSTAFAAGSLARNSVGSAQIKKDAVSASKLRTGSVGSSEVQDGTLNGRDVADGGLGGADLADGSVTGADLADASVTGADLADASIGGQKIAGNSIGLQAVEQSTQDYFTNVPTTQVVPATPRDVALNVNPQPVLTWTVPAGQVGLNVVQSQVTIRSRKTATISCDVAVDGTVLTRVRQTIVKTDLLADFATVPLTTTARLTEGAVVATRCNVGEANVATALVADQEDGSLTRPTTMIATRVAR